jgi:prepilin peptidase CpaA
MTTGAMSYVLLTGLSIALLGAAVSDLRHRRIGNPLNATLAFSAPAFWWASGLPLWPGVALQLAVAALVLAMLTGLFAIGALGGGDVKLLTALALWLPWQRFLELVTAMALLGGALAGLVLFWARKRTAEGPLQVPYGVAIAAAGLWVLATRYVAAGAAPLR